MSTVPKSSTTNIARRLFLVGCSRSGTTMLQVSLATHPRIQSFPETFFFRLLLKGVSRVPAYLNLPSGKQAEAFERLMKELDHPELQSLVPEKPMAASKCVDVFVAMLDGIARESGADIWLEKTPMHLLNIPFIAKRVPKVQFVHILRDGRDVVASIYERAGRFPDLFPKQHHVSFGIKRWNRSMAVASRYLGQPGHAFTIYEDLVEHPAATLQRLCADIGIDYVDEMAATRDGKAKDIIPAHRKWIANAATPPTKNARKFVQVFDAEEQQTITSALKLSLYQKLVQQIRDNA